MEDLNKHQLILLTLLVSFVTSIATGIITFTLLQEAPVEVTQTINRVVEKTIERVVPEEGGKETIKEITTVVSEEDLVLDSIDKNAKSVVRLITIGFDGKEIVSGIGLVVSVDGLIAVDERSFGSGNYQVMLHDGARYSIISKSYKDPNSGLLYLKVGKVSTDQYKFYPAIISGGSLRLGQTVIAISGKDRNAVAIGRISSLDKIASGEISKISTDIPVSKSEIGSPIVNLSGEIVGIQAPIADEADYISYYPLKINAQSIKTATSELSK